MKFSDRIKKEMTEGIVKAILEDAQYRVIDCGIEKVLRELSCLSATEYGKLGYPHAMSHLPDFTVMNREQTTKQLVEVKYRSTWGKNLFEEVREQVRIFGEIVLISVNAKAEDPRGYNMPSRFLRCCGLKFEKDTYLIQQNKNGSPVWTSFNQISDGSGLWWSMLKLHEKFPQLSEENNKNTLFQAVNALAGILDG
ncbi:hypothetical protein M4R22_02765 [Acidovorax sp. GBBC 3334]|uniref:hypothetical protein n=1 Tax=Acidovorax sp. GBBC 3334 TaxID=2940496 RepID=UPI0023020D7F|nr:hypothetical protein [Acidovorax sp. GBBC 3334]MDA8453678.1 hypothetical protein [Acidovorax sp. GBBC 3334]